MLTTPRKDYGGRGSSTPQKVPLKGLFQDGVWHCNCQPRIPASHFLVRKEGPNKGRWFYTCQEPKEKGCGFFLWAEDAAPREMRAVINNSRSEIGPASENSMMLSSTAVNKNTVEGHIVASNQFLADLGRKAEEEFGEWPLSMEDEVEVVKAVEQASRPIPYPETPRKTVKFNEIVTPGSKRKRDEAEAAWPTPATGQSSIGKDKDVFITPATRLKGGMFDGNERRAGLLSPSVTPTPNRFRDGDITETTSDPASDPKDYDITQEVLALLCDQHLDEETTTKLKQTLNRHALRTQGIIRGRDITRVALKVKDTKIAELQQRISALETEREMDKVVIKHFKSDMAESVARRARPGRGRGRES